MTCKAFSTRRFSNAQLLASLGRSWTWQDGLGGVRGLLSDIMGVSVSWDQFVFTKHLAMQWEQKDF